MRFGAWIWSNPWKWRGSLPTEYLDQTGLSSGEDWVRRQRHAVVTGEPTRFPSSAICYILSVDPLRRDDIERSRLTPPEEKALQALEVMRLGIQLQSEKLRRAHPDDSRAEIQRRLWEWLALHG